MRKIQFYISAGVFLFLISCVSSYSPSSYDVGKKLMYMDELYETSIKSVEWYPISTSGTYITQLGSIIPFQTGQTMRLEFDHLSEGVESFIVKILPANADWSRSSLSDMDFLDEYNEFRISDYDISVDTKVSYTHFKFDVPPISKSGNFLLIVYKEGNENDLYISRRFVIYESLVSIIPERSTSFNTFSGHTIDFNVNYNGYNFDDPFSHISATLRQNNRWDNAIEHIIPSMVKADIKSVRFQYFDQTNRFNPGNEFRYFDLRSIISPGQNIRSIDKNTLPISVALSTDQSRGSEPYSFHRDLNGAFNLINFDNRNQSYYADYVNVTFTLESSNISEDENIYLSGQLTDWKKKEENRLSKVTEGIYSTTLLLKQGWYDYQYEMVSSKNNPFYLEGDYINTENQYEILIYDRNPINRNERCVGYLKIGVNERPR